MTFRQLIVTLAVAALPAALATAAPAPTPPAEAAGQQMEVAQEGNYGRGFAIFQRYCRSCHGKKAEGDGHVAPYLKEPPANLTRLAVENDGDFPTERVMSSIDGREDMLPIHGRDMPIWGAVFQVDEGQTEADVAGKLADLVAYLQGIQVEGDSDGEQDESDE